MSNNVTLIDDDNDLMIDSFNLSPVDIEIVLFMKNILLILSIVY